MIDTSKEAVGALALAVPESQPFSDNLILAQETLIELAAQLVEAQAERDEARAELDEAKNTTLEEAVRLQSGAVKVRELVWKPWSGGVSQADSAFGVYHTWSGHYRPPGWIGGIASESPENDAQQEYAARILAAIETTSADTLARANPDQLAEEIAKRLANTDPDVEPWGVRWAEELGDALLTDSGTSGKATAIRQLKRGEG
jgi:hypothetical protein